MSFIERSACGQEWEIWFLHLVRGLLHGAQVLQDSGVSMQEFDVQLLPQQEQFLVVLHPSKCEGGFNKSQSSKLLLCEVKALYSVFLW